eukprot:EC798162.1.p2 GENE.EC798162.1~~EC798162.1.p2  ORF type:complete len:168 (-),score=28.98 EC798162.1:16-519(-)
MQSVCQNQDSLHPERNGSSRAVLAVGLGGHLVVTPSDPQPTTSTQSPPEAQQQQEEAFSAPAARVVASWRATAPHTHSAQLMTMMMTHQHSALLLVALVKKAQQREEVLVLLWAGVWVLVVVTMVGMATRGPPLRRLSSLAWGVCVCVCEEKKRRREARARRVSARV